MTISGWKFKGLSLAFAASTFIAFSTLSFAEEVSNTLQSEREKVTKRILSQYFNSSDDYRPQQGGFGVSRLGTPKIQFKPGTATPVAAEYRPGISIQLTSKGQPVAPPEKTKILLRISRYDQKGTSQNAQNPFESQRPDQPIQGTTSVMDQFPNGNLARNGKPSPRTGGGGTPTPGVDYITPAPNSTQVGVEDAMDVPRSNTGGTTQVAGGTPGKNPVQPLPPTKTQQGTATPGGTSQTNGNSPSFTTESGDELVQDSTGRWVPKDKNAIGRDGEPLAPFRMGGVTTPEDSSPNAGRQPGSNGPAPSTSGNSDSGSDTSTPGSPGSVAGTPPQGGAPSAGTPTGGGVTGAPTTLPGGVVVTGDNATFNIYNGAGGRSDLSRPNAESGNVRPPADREDGPETADTTSERLKRDLLDLERRFPKNGPLPDELTSSSMDSMKDAEDVLARSNDLLKRDTLGLKVPADDKNAAIEIRNRLANNDKLEDAESLETEYQQSRDEIDQQIAKINSEKEIRLTQLESDRETVAEALRNEELHPDQAKAFSEKISKVEFEIETETRKKVEELEDSKKSLQLPDDAPENLAQAKAENINAKKSEELQGKLGYTRDAQDGESKTQRELNAEFRKDAKEMGIQAQAQSIKNREYKKNEGLSKDKGCAVSGGIGTAAYKSGYQRCQDTVEFVEDAQIINQVGQGAGALAVNIQGQQYQRDAFEKGTQSAALEGAAETADLAANKDLLMGGVNLAIAMKHWSNKNKHETFAENLRHTRDHILENDVVSVSKKQDALDRVGDGTTTVGTVKNEDGSVSRVNLEEGSNIERYHDGIAKIEGYSDKEDHSMASEADQKAYLAGKTFDRFKLNTKYRTATTVNRSRCKQIPRSQFADDASHLEAIQMCRIEEGAKSDARDQEIAEKKFAIQDDLDEATFRAAEEQDAAAKAAKRGMFISMVQGLQQITSGFFAKKSAENIKESAENLKGRRPNGNPNNPIFRSDPLADGGANAPRSGVVITGDGEAATADLGDLETGEELLDDDTAFDLGDPFATSNESGGVVDAPAPGVFQSGKGDAGSSGGLAGLSAASLGAARGDSGSGSSQPSYADLGGSGGAYASSGGGYRGGRRARTGSKNGGDLGFLAKLLDKQVDQAKDQKPVDYQSFGRGPASVGSSLLGPSANLFKKVSNQYQRQFKRGSVGG